MSHKGKVFTVEDFNKNRIDALRRRRVSEEAIKQEIEKWCAQETERNRIVAFADDGEALIAEELDQRALNRMSPKAKRIAGTMMRYPADVRAEIVKAFEADGTLKIPFKRA